MQPDPTDARSSLPDATALGLLVLEAQGGELRAREALFRQLQPLLRNLVQKHLDAEMKRDPGVEDFVQGVWLSVLRSFETMEYRGRPAFLNWLQRVTVHAVKNQIDWFQASKRDRSNTVYIEETGIQQLVHHDRAVVTRLTVEDALASLLPECAVILRKVYFEGYSVNQAAKTLGIPESTARYRHRRGLGQLGLILGKALREEYGDALP